ncbi:hypothetical protein BP5796_06300 [Coleophoma crateriformis]|uniref:SsDNA binding protein n=1 Tax=Coleophoma crateriformis TaxID=565419 RepID=A0A3D8RWS0_9HELO|nr:hypothetical protein BP5796_06300 [Coleophoma crateriformis]
MLKSNSTRDITAISGLVKTPEQLANATTSSPTEVCARTNSPRSRPLSIYLPNLNDSLSYSPASNLFVYPEMSSFLLRRAVPVGARAFSTSTARSSFAKMTIVGRLGDVPAIEATSTGREILKYVVGTNSGPKDNQKTSWFRVVSFMDEGPQRDFIASLDKGTLVYVEGDASMSSYQDENQKTRTSLSIVQQRLEVLSPRKPSQ